MSWKAHPVHHQTDALVTAAGMRALDAGAVGGDSGWPYRITMLLVTLAGLFIVSALMLAYLDKMVGHKPDAGDKA